MEYIVILEERISTLEKEIREIKNEIELKNSQETKQEIEGSKNYFTIGSTMDEVIEVMGEPSSYIKTAPEARKIHYGISTVYFYQDKVISYDNLEGNLRVKVK